jgi:hypothetical protein
MFFSSRNERCPQTAAIQRSKAELADDFRSRLVSLTNEAKGNGARHHDLLDILDREMQRLNTERAIADLIL